MFFSKAWKFLKKNVFYIGLVLCVAAVGVISVIASLPKEEEPTEIVDENKSETLEEAQDRKETEAEDKEAAEEAPNEEETVPSKKPASSSGASVKASLTKPLDGEIITSFSEDTLVFNSTLNMWMTHNGVDISAENSSEVCAALPGEVTSVMSDDSKGKVVKISHANGGETVYAGLTESIVSEGAKVNAGQKIGTAGTPAFESDIGPHLHFEYLADGEYRDPADYFG